jgi:ABC-type multidrug transport system ATPase subunit
MKTKRISHLSSGQNKLMMILQGFLHTNNLLICDEPTDNLDFATKENFYNYLLNLRKENKDITIIVSSHNLDEVSNFCD